ncbi:MAG: hypothetical protein IJO32_02800, partial [Bacilli bacterium]|nr:hypothetical protein [Bacilli bacterium]
MIKKISCLILAIALFLINTNIIYALEIYENDGYNIYFNSIKSNAKYKVAAIVGEGDRIFYDLDGITQILKSKGGTSINVYKLGESLDEDAVKTSISKISSELGETIEDNNIQALTDYTGIKEKDT